MFQGAVSSCALVLCAGLVCADARTGLATSAPRSFALPEVPVFADRRWNPPLSPQRTYYVDSRCGDDARTGLSPAESWKTLYKLREIALGPGERCLLKRGSVFDEELRISARGSAQNWAEIGAYGEGARPQVRRTRHINERCAFLPTAEYLAIRDLVVCDAGQGLVISCERPNEGHLLIERCVAHHIEGNYIFNSHGIPEWKDAKGRGKSCGIWLVGGQAHHAVMRDCEFYQCSCAFNVVASDSYVTRLYCHDNFVPNTSSHPGFYVSRGWLTDSVFDAAGWQASAGTMGVMLIGNRDVVIRGCHFLNQPDSGSPDEGGIDFEKLGENCLVDRCTFRNNAGAAIEVLGLNSPQMRNIHIRGCKFDRNNFARKLGPAEIVVFGDETTPRERACSSGVIAGNGYVLMPGVSFYANRTCSSNDWRLVGNRGFDCSADLDRAYPYPEPPDIDICDEIWTDEKKVILSARVTGKNAGVSWEQVNGEPGVRFERCDSVCTRVDFPSVGDYGVALLADTDVLWRRSRTAVHVLSKGSYVFKAWPFAKNLETDSWRAEETGCEYEFHYQKPKKGPGDFVRSYRCYPVQTVCGGYFVVAIKDSATARIVTPGEKSVGIVFDEKGCNVVCLKLQNMTNSQRMRLWWQGDLKSVKWDKTNSRSFDVNPKDRHDVVYYVEVPPFGSVRRLRVDFSADGEPVTGTCRIDYIWAGRKGLASE